MGSDFFETRLLIVHITDVNKSESPSRISPGPNLGERSGDLGLNRENRFKPEVRLLRL